MKKVGQTALFKKTGRYLSGICTLNERSASKTPLEYYMPSGQIKSLFRIDEDMPPVIRDEKAASYRATRGHTV